MPITAADIRALIAAALPGAEIDVQDTTGAGDHYAARVISTRFQSLGPMDRHRMIYAALGTAMQADIHALALTTQTPAEAGLTTGRTP